MFKHSSLKLPLNDSTNGLSVGNTAPGEVQDNIEGARPLVHRFRDKFRAVIDLDPVRNQAPEYPETIENIDHIIPLHGLPGRNFEAFPAQIILVQLTPSHFIPKFFIFRLSNSLPSGNRIDRRPPADEGVSCIQDNHPCH